MTPSSPLHGGSDTPVERMGQLTESARQRNERIHVTAHPPDVTGWSWKQIVMSGFLTVAAAIRSLKDDSQGPLT